VFSFFFIPMFPVGRAKRYVVCNSCGNIEDYETYKRFPPSALPVKGNRSGGCPYCGSASGGDANFCPHCGAPTG